MSSPSEITSLLDDWRDGREDAFERLFALVFGGLTIEEAAELVGVSFNTAVRDWEMARAWLFRSIHGGVDGP